MCADAGAGMLKAHLVQAEFEERMRKAAREVKFPDFGPAPIEGEATDITDRKLIARDPDPALPAS